MSRSRVNRRPRIALRMREKSAAAMPLMISAARSALNCSASAFSRPRSRNTLPLPRTTPFRFSSQHRIAPERPRNLEDAGAKALHQLRNAGLGAYRGER